MQASLLFRIPHTKVEYRIFLPHPQYRAICPVIEYFCPWFTWSVIFTGWPWTAFCVPWIHKRPRFDKAFDCPLIHSPESCSSKSYQILGRSFSPCSAMTVPWSWKLPILLIAASPYDIDVVRRELSFLLYWCPAEEFILSAGRINISLLFSRIVINRRHKRRQQILPDSNISDMQ